MANTATPAVNNGTRTWTIDTTATINLGNAHHEVVGSKIIEFVANGATFSAVLKKKLTGSSVANASALTTWYEDMSVGTTPVAAGVAITAAALVKVYLDQCDCIVTITMTSGTLILEERNAEG